MNCNYDKHVEACHIKPISKFDLDITNYREILTDLINDNFGSYVSIIKKW